MKKSIYLSILFLVIFSLSSYSQIRIGIDGGAIISTSANSEYNTGVTLGLSGKYVVKNKLGLGLTTGFYRYHHENKIFGDYGIEYRMTVVPVLLSADYSFGMKKLRPYAGADIGLFVLNETIDNTIGLLSVTNNTGTSFGFSPSLGLRFLFSEKVSANVAVKYTHIILSETGFPNINAVVGLAYTFK